MLFACFCDLFVFARSAHFVHLPRAFLEAHMRCFPSLISFAHSFSSIYCPVYLQVMTSNNNRSLTFHTACLPPCMLSFVLCDLFLCFLYPVKEITSGRYIIHTAQPHGLDSFFRHAYAKHGDDVVAVLSTAASLLEPCSCVSHDIVFFRASAFSWMGLTINTY